MPTDSDPGQGFMNHGTLCTMNHGPWNAMYHDGLFPIIRSESQFETLELFMNFNYSLEIQYRPDWYRTGVFLARELCSNFEIFSKSSSSRLKVTSKSPRFCLRGQNRHKIQ